MKYSFCGKEISGPFTIPSGVVATEISVMEKISEIDEIGILTTKSTGPEPREGNREPIIVQYSPFSFINAVGLTNPGSKEFAKRLSKMKIREDKFILGSIFGGNENEFYNVAEDLLPYVDGFELNVSCPHADKYGQSLGGDKKLVYKITQKISSLKKPVFVKVSPNVDYIGITKAAVEGNAFGITAINTVGPETYTIDGYSVLTNGVGGKSGKEILQTGLKCVGEISKTVDLPVIGCGGISTAEDVKKYKKAGASHYGIGSALAGMDTKEIKDYFHELGEDLINDTANANRLLKQVNMKYEKYKIKKKTDLAEDLFLLEFYDDFEAKHGQFIFTWLPEKGEKPFSILDDEPLKLLVQKRGCFTDKLSKLEKNDMVYIRGPYGKSPKIEDKVLLVGGGTGIAGLYLFAKNSDKEVMTLTGTKDRYHLAYIEEFGNYGEVRLATEDGSLGHKGFVTDLLEETLDAYNPDFCVNCGPKGMVETALKEELKSINPKNIYSSIEFITRCGIGLCGSCATSKGYRSCVDGTFMKKEELGII